MPKTHVLMRQIGLTLVPLLLLIGLLAPGLAWNENLKKIEAAVVNEDEMVTVDGQIIPLGRQLTAALVDSNREQNFKWVIATEEKAREGLLNGKYAAVVRIPKDFSATATKLGNPDTAQQAVIQVETSKVLGVADTAIGQAVAAAAVRALNTTLTKNYLDRIYIGFNKLGTKFSELKSATQTLAEGNTRLANGLSELSKNSELLNSGATQLADGMNQLADGMNQLSNNSSQLRHGGEDLQAGIRKLAAGTKHLNDSLIGLRKITQELEPLLKDLPDLKPILTELITQLDTWEPLIKSLTKQLQVLTSDSKDLAQKLKELLRKLDSLAEEIPCPKNFNEQQCQAFKAGVTAADKVLQPYRKTIEEFSKNLNSRLSKIAEALVKINTLAEKLQPLRTQLLEKIKNSEALRPGELLTKIQLLLQGIAQLDTGVQDAAIGTEKYISGVKKYTEGVDSATIGIRKAHIGAGAFAAGLQKYTAGVGQAKTGAEQLAEGTTKLAEGVAHGAKDIPSYDEQQRKNLAKVVANPVAGDKLNEVVLPNIPWLTLVVICTLWLSALASYLVIPAVRKTAALSTKPSVLIHLDALLPGWLTALAATTFAAVALRLLLPLSALEVASITGVLLLAACSFVAINQALVAWLGRAGQLVAVAFAALSLGAGMSQNPWISGIAGLAPTAPALTGLRAIIVGSPELSVSLLSLTIWLIMAFILGLAAVTQARTIDVKQLLS